MFWLLLSLSTEVDAKYCVVDAGNATCSCADVTYTSVTTADLNSSLYDANTGVYLRFCAAPAEPIDIGSANTLISLASESTQVTIQLNLTGRIPPVVQFDNIIATVQQTDQTVLSISYLSVTNSIVTPLNTATKFNIMSETFTVDMASLSNFGTITTADLTLAGINMDILPQPNSTLNVLPVSKEQILRLNVPSSDVEFRFGKRNVTLWKGTTYFAIQLASQGQTVLGCASGIYTLTCDDGLYPSDFLNPTLSSAYFIAGLDPTFVINGSNWPVTSRHITVSNIGFYANIIVALGGTNIPLSYTFHDAKYKLRLDVANSSIQGNLTVGAGGEILNNVGAPTWFSFPALTRVDQATGKLSWPEDVTLNVTKYTDANFFARPVVSVIFHEMSGANPTVTRQIVLQNQFRAETSITNNGTAITSTPITGAFYSEAGNKQVRVAVAIPRYGEVYNLRGIMDNYMDIYCNLFDFTCTELAVTFETANTGEDNLGAGEYALTTACYHRNSDGYKCLAARLNALPQTTKQTICIADDIALSCSSQDHIAINPCDVPRLDRVLDTSASTYILNIYSNLLQTEAIDLQLFAGKNLVIEGGQTPQVFITVSDANVTRSTNLLVVDGCSVTMIGTSIDCPTVFLTNCLYSLTNENLTVTATNVTADIAAFDLFLFPSVQNVGIVLENGSYPITLSANDVTVNTTVVTVNSAGYLIIYPNQATSMSIGWQGTGSLRQMEVNYNKIPVASGYSISRLTNRTGLVSDISFTGDWTNATFVSPPTFLWKDCHVRFASLPVALNLHPQNGTTECNGLSATAPYTVANPVVLDTGTWQIVQGGGTLTWSSVTVMETVNVNAASLVISSLNLTENVTFTDNTDTQITDHLYMYPGSVMSDATYGNTSVIHLENFDFRNPPYLNAIRGTPSISINHVLGTDDPQLLEAVEKDIRITCSPAFSCDAVMAATTFTSSYSDTASKVSVSCSTPDYGNNVCLQIRLLSPPTVVNPNANNSQNKTALIVGIVVALVVIAVVVVVVVLLVLRRKRNFNNTAKGNSKTNDAVNITAAGLGQCPVPLRRAKDQISSFHPPPIPLRQQDLEKLQALADLEAQEANSAKSSPKRGKSTPQMEVSSDELVPASPKRYNTSMSPLNKSSGRRPTDGKRSPSPRGKSPQSRRATNTTEASSYSDEPEPRRRPTSSSQRRDTGATDASSSRRGVQAGRPQTAQGRRPPGSRPRISFDVSASEYSYSDYDDADPPPRRQAPPPRRANPQQRKPPKR